MTELPRWGLYGLGISLLIKVIVASNLLGFYGPCPTDGRYRALRLAQRRGRGEDSGRAKAELDFYRHCSAADSHRAVSTRRTMERL
jgi:hypothetical protein